MKNYLYRIKVGCKPTTFAFWWLFRLLMIYAFVASFFKEPFDITVPVWTAIGFVCTFFWEISMASNENSFLRFLPSSIQTFAILGIFASSFLGRFLNLNYSTSWFDPLLQFLFGAGAVFFGWEIACAIIKKEKRSATKAMQFYVAFGIAFFAIQVLELFEFSIDQILGNLTGTVTDTQHWSFALAQGTARENPLLDPISPDRWPIMDTMIDMTLSTISAFIALLIVNVTKYRLKGKFKYDLDFEASSQKNSDSETEVLQ